MDIVEINEIPVDVKLEGYLWMSDEKTPRIYDNVPVDMNLLSSVNPFVLEGCLVDKENGLSFIIKQLNGKPVIYRYILVMDDEVCARTYESVRMDGRKLRFAQRWREKPDDVCCLGMPVLEAAEEVFLGFSI